MSDKLLPLRSQGVSLGRHLIMDAWRVSTELLDDPPFVREALRRAVDACGATLINLCVHHFSPYGVTAAATLAESHMVVHTWPEHGYLGADLFLCGSADPRPAIDSLIETFEPGEVRLRELTRGLDVGEIEAPAGERVESA